MEPKEVQLEPEPEPEPLDSEEFDTDLHVFRVSERKLLKLEEEGHVKEVF